MNAQSFFLDARPAERPSELALEVTPWWQSRAAIVMLVLAAFVPLMYPDFPPLVDLPGHMGRYRVQLDLRDSGDLQRYFVFNWSLIGNLGVDLLIIPFAKLFGLELATKLIVSAIPPLTVAGFLAVAREVHGRLPATALFALPLAYNQPFHFGFINFTLSMALALLAFALWVRLGKGGHFKIRAALFVPLSAVLFVAHVYGWAALGLLAFSNELARHRAGKQRVVNAAVRAARNCLVLALPLVLMIVWRSQGDGPSFAGWFNMKLKVLWLVSVFRGSSASWESCSASFLIFLFIFLRMRLRAELAPTLLIAAGFMLLAVVILPFKLFGSAYADMRLAPYLMATSILAFDLRTSSLAASRRLAALGLVFFAAHLGVRTMGFAAIADDQSRQLTALDVVPTGSKVVNLVGGSCTNSWALDPNAHLGSFVITRRSGFSNDQWITLGMNLLQLRDQSFGKWGMDPSQTVMPRKCATEEFPAVESALASIPRGQFDYAWLINIYPSDPALLAGWSPIWRSGNSSLYRRIEVAEGG